MKVLLFGDGAWATSVLTQIASDPALSVVGLIIRRKPTDRTLEAEAERLALPVFCPDNVNDPDFVARIAALAPDLNVSMSYDQIIGSALWHMAPHGFINCHAGALPFYRGRNPLNWALINGACEFGITVHYIDDDGIDTGDIILQRKYPIHPTDDYASLLKLAEIRCPEILHDAIGLIRNGKANRQQQKDIHPVGFYCPRRRKGDERIDWQSGSRRIHDFVRALVTPGPGARATAKGREWAILATELIDGAPVYICTCGEVVGRNARGVTVKTGDTTLHILKMAGIDANGHVEHPFVPAFPLGTRFS